jgi:hypothetical protein
VLLTILVIFYMVHFSTLTPNRHSLQKKSYRTFSIQIIRHLAHNHALETRHITLLGSDFKVSVDDGDGQQNTSTTAKGAEEVAANRKSTNASTTKSSGGRNNTLKLLVHRLLTVTGHDETLLLELLGDIAGRRAGYLNPSLREDSAGDEHVYDEDGGLEWVGESLGDAERRRPRPCQYLS